MPTWSISWCSGKRVDVILYACRRKRDDTHNAKAPDDASLGGGGGSTQELSRANFSRGG